MLEGMNAQGVFLSDEMGIQTLQTRDGFKRNIGFFSLFSLISNYGRSHGGLVLSTLQKAVLRS